MERYLAGNKEVSFALLPWGPTPAVLKYASCAFLGTAYATVPMI